MTGVVNMSVVVQYKFVEQYSAYPGGRFIKLGKYSGEDFRETVLRDIFVSNKKINIDATGIATSFSPSFLDEAFRPLAEEYGLAKFNNTVKFFATDNPSLNEKMMFYVTKINDK